MHNESPLPIGSVEPGSTDEKQPSMARLYKKAPREGSRVCCAYPSYTDLQIWGHGNANGEPKLAVCIESNCADYCFGAASALAIIASTEAVVIGW